MCYWEGAWITVDSACNGTWKQANHDRWTTYGCGWATAYVAGYDSQVTVNDGTYVDGGAGSVVDNQVFFDATGKPLASLSVFGNVYESLSDKTPSGQEMLTNNGFEADSDGTAQPTGWTVVSNNVSQIAVRARDSHDGNNGFASWSENDYNFTLEQTVANAAAGTYTFVIYMQGTNPNASESNVYAYVNVGGKQVGKCDISISQDWQKATVTFTIEQASAVTVGLCVDVGSGVWVSVDDASLKVAE